jgi:hypothetical protein
MEKVMMPRTFMSTAALNRLGGNRLRMMSRMLSSGVFCGALGTDPSVGTSA